MNEDNSPPAQEGKSWLEKLSQAFSHSPSSKEDLLELLKEAHNNQILDSLSLDIIEGAIQVADLKVREIMIPRPQMVLVKACQSPEEFLPIIIESGHSRFPVIGDNPDEVLGILLAKDLLPLVLSTDLKNFRIKDILRPVTVCPESKRLNILLNEFRTNRNHMAVVIDEYGGISGLITIEDVLEEIVGEIEDEYDLDAEDNHITPAEEGLYIVNALTPIETFNEHFGIDFSDDEFDTIGGIVMQHFGHLPARNEEVEIEGLSFRVLAADTRRIRLLGVSSSESSTPSK